MDENRGDKQTENLLREPGAVAEHQRARVEARDGDHEHGAPYPRPRERGYERVPVAFARLGQFNQKHRARARGPQHNLRLAREYRPHHPSHGLRHQVLHRAHLVVRGYRRQSPERDARREAVEEHQQRRAHRLHADPVYPVAIKQRRPPVGDVVDHPAAQPTRPLVHGRHVRRTLGLVREQQQPPLLVIRPNIHRRPQRVHQVGGSKLRRLRGRRKYAARHAARAGGHLRRRRPVRGSRLGRHPPRRLSELGILAFAFAFVAVAALREQVRELLPRGCGLQVTLVGVHRLQERPSRGESLKRGLDCAKALEPAEALRPGRGEVHLGDHDEEHRARVATVGGAEVDGLVEGARGDVAVGQDPAPRRSLRGG